MNEPVVIGNATLYCGDCLDILRTLPDNSIEACLTDPPYGLSNHTEADIRACMSAWLAGKPYQHGKAGFMGKSWDSFVPGPEMWKELYRVLKPGAHLLVFAGTRTADLMSLALRLAGFEAREMCLWVFGAGFPKALDVSAAIDKMKGMEREVVGKYMAPRQIDRGTYRDEFPKGTYDYSDSDTSTPIGSRITDKSITAPAFPEAAQWDGWKSALKPCYEPILLFRKPLDGTIAETVLKWGCGGLNVGACRVESGDSEPNARDRKTIAQKTVDNAVYAGGWLGTGDGWNGQQGRYPGNLIVSSDEEVERCFPVVSSGGKNGSQYINHDYKGGNTYFKNNKQTGVCISDKGSASRFFQHCDFTIDEIAEMNGIELKRIVYSGKASKRDRDEGCEGMEEREATNRHAFSGLPDLRMDHAQNRNPARNHHPTCKPSSLLRHLLRMVVPPGATVIDPFFGSGSTGKAALLEGFNVIGIEREPEYFEIAQARVAHVSPEAFTVNASIRKPVVEPAQQQTRLDFEEAA